MSEVKVQPARTNAEDLNLIADLDEIHAKKVTVKCNGKEFPLLPVTLDMATEVDAQNRAMRNYVSRIDSKNPSDMETVYDQYFLFFRIICPEMSLEEVKKMTVVQVNRLYIVMSKHVYTELSGKTLSEIQDEEKKKTQLSHSA